MSLRTRLGVVALVFLTLVLIASGLSALMVRSWNRNLEQLGEARMAAEEVSELSLAYTDQESGIRGYLISGDPTFLEPYRDGVALGNRVFDRLSRRPLVATRFDASLAAVREAGDAWRDEVALPTLDDIATAPAEEVEQEMFGRLRAELDALDRVVNAELETVIRRTDRVRRNTFGVLFASAMAAIIGTALVTVLFRRWVTQPLARIGATARRLATDDTAALPDADSPELQDVTDAIRSLQSSLVHARDEAVTAFDALEQSAVLAVQVRSELADEIGEMPSGWTAQSVLIPAEGLVAGDCFDVGLLDADHLYLVMIDVTGHGATAALDALKAKSQLRAALRSRLTPGAALDWLSRENRRDDGADLLTAVVMVIELSTGECSYASAGHPPALLTDGDEHRELEPTGPLVGAFPTTWRTDGVTIPPGWLLFVYTDGITDTVGPDRERFGDDRLRDCLDTTDPRSAVEQVRASCDAFRANGRTDDVTAIAIRRSPTPTAPESTTTVHP